MPQMNKGGKFVLGISFANPDLNVRIPTQAIQEYAITKENKVFFISGSKETGGFVVTRKELIYNSKIGNILKEMPALCNYELSKGRFLKYKGRLYCWTDISSDGIIIFEGEMLRILDIAVGTKLLSIRSSDIAFVMGAKGPLLDKADIYEGKIQTF